MITKTSLFKYLNAIGISGYENNIAKVILEKNKKKYQFKTDNLGNLYFSYNLENCQKKILITCHMDETGFVVSQINENGTILLVNQGGFKYHTLINARVVLTNCDNKLFNGVIYLKELGETSLKEISNINHYFADFGFKSKKDAEEKFKIKPGDPIAFLSETKELVNDRIIAKSVDNRLSVAIVSECMDELAQIAKSNNVGITFGFLVQEEVGTRGSFVVTHNVECDLIINLDISPIRETLVDSKKVYNYGHLGEGVHLRVLDRTYITKKHILIFLEEVCKKYKIKHQYFLSGGGTDSGTLALSKFGYTIIPLTMGYRYNHGPSQLFDFNDVINTKNLLISLIKELKPNKVTKLCKTYDFE